jgi:hypothetical protein
LPVGRPAVVPVGGAQVHALVGRDLEVRHDGGQGRDGRERPGVGRLLVAPDAVAVLHHELVLGLARLHGPAHLGRGRGLHLHGHGLEAEAQAGHLLRRALHAERVQHGQQLAAGGLGVIGVVEQAGLDLA